MEMRGRGPGWGPARCPHTLCDFELGWPHLGGSGLAMPTHNPAAPALSPSVLSLGAVWGCGDLTSQLPSGAHRGLSDGSVGRGHRALHPAAGQAPDRLNLGPLDRGGAGRAERGSSLASGATMQALLLPQPEKHARGEETQSFLPWGGSRPAFAIRTPNLWAQNARSLRRQVPRGSARAGSPGTAFPG